MDRTCTQLTEAEEQVFRQADLVLHDNRVFLAGRIGELLQKQVLLASSSSNEATMSRLYSLHFFRSYWTKELAFRVRRRKPLRSHCRFRHRLFVTRDDNHGEATQLFRVFREILQG